MKKSTSPKLKKGDLIGIAAPSRHTFEFQEEITQGIEILHHHGYRTKLADNFDKKHFSAAGAAQERVQAFNKMLVDPEIKAIVFSNGGDAANQILDFIDYNSAIRNPKIFIGSSDITHILLALNKKTGLTTFYGPNLKDLPSLTRPSQDDFFKALEGDPIVYPAEMEIIQAGNAKGKLLGGNLFVLNCLLATDFISDLSGTILYFEDIDEGLGGIEFQLNQLKLTRVVNKTAGLIIGHIETEEKRNINKMILEIFGHIKIPIIKVNYFGHNINDFKIIPNSIGALINTNTKKFELTEQYLM